MKQQIALFNQFYAKRKQQIALFNQFYLSILKVIYNIGTEILYFQCFVHHGYVFVPKSIIPEESKAEDL